MKDWTSYQNKTYNNDVCKLLVYFLKNYKIDNAIDLGCESGNETVLYLLKEYQRKGIGKRLFNIAANKIKESGYNEFFICCNKYNINAQEFYKKMGGIIDEIDDENIDKSIPQVKFIYKI